MAIRETPAEYSSSTARALEIAAGRSAARNDEVISCIDLLVGIFRSHPDTAEPLDLLDHTQLPHERFSDLLTATDGAFGPFGNLKPGTLTARKSASDGLIGPDAYDAQALAALETAQRLAVEFRSNESEAVRLRDLFGGVLLGDNQASVLLQKTLAETFLSLDEVRSSYPDFLEWKLEPQRYLDFLKEHHPPPRFPVSGFSADTIADIDFVGIGPEVNAMAYLISARTLVPPLAIGLFGDWGSGKSFFMRALRGRINTLTKHARSSGRPQKEIDLYKYVVQIEFNAWHYVEGQLWASLVEHILRNLQTATEEGETELQIRKNHWLKKLRAARAEDESIKALKQSLQSALDVSVKRIETAQHQLEKKQEELQRVTAEGFWQFMEVPKKVKSEAREIFDAAGLGQVPESAERLAAAIEESRSLWQRGSALLAPLRAGGSSRSAWLLGVIAVAATGPLVSLAMEQIPISELTRVMVALGSIMSAAGAGVTVANQWVGGLLARAEAAANALEAQKEQAQKAYVDKVESLRSQQAQVEDQLAEVEHEARLKRLEIEELQRELDGLTPGRLLLDFINERVGSEDYRQHLGVAALIRRDFEKLSELIRTSNEGFLKTDTGVVTPEDKHRINRIVLYIDDLDRCPPERVVEVLQAVHLLMAFPLFVVVVAVDSRWLSQSLQSHYDKLLAQDTSREDSQNQATADDYLEKIFQIPFWVRPLGERARMRIVQGLVAPSLAASSETQTHAGTHLPDRNVNAGLVDWEANEPARPLRTDVATDLTPRSLEITPDELRCMEDVKGLLGDSPRSVKRFVNVYRLIKAGEAGRSNRFLSEADDAGYRIVLFLLAIVTGLPEAATVLISRLDADSSDTVGEHLANLTTGSQNDAGESTSELATLHGWLRESGHELWSDMQISKMMTGSDRVRRYTYRHHR